MEQVGLTKHSWSKARASDLIERNAFFSIWMCWFYSSINAALHASKLWTQAFYVPIIFTRCASLSADLKSSDLETILSIYPHDKKCSSVSSFPVWVWENKAEKSIKATFQFCYILQYAGAYWLLYGQHSDVYTVPLSQPQWDMSISPAGTSPLFAKVDFVTRYFISYSMCLSRDHTVI